MKFQRIAITFTSFLLAAACSKAQALPDAAGSGLTIAPVAHASFERAAPESPPIPESPMDALISARVRDAILADRVLAMDSGTVQVATSDGVVTLTGSVRNAETRRRMEVVVEAVGSVVRVDDRLRIDPNPAGPVTAMESSVDRAISDRVRLALEEDLALARDAANVRVTTNEGVVTLSGTVGDPTAKHRAVVVASAVGSVVRVVDELRVRGG
jgi:osmotically-inducible protein OsmY